MHFLSFAVLVSMVTTAFAATSSCPTGSVYDGVYDLCYLFDKSYEKFESAQLYCEKKGGSLSSIGSASQNSIVASLAKTSGMSTYWIGMTAENKREWEWEDGSLVAYTNWKGGYTPNANGQDKCVEMDCSTGLWKAKRCTDDLRFVCTVPKENGGQTSSAPTQKPTTSTTKKAVVTTTTTTTKHVTTPSPTPSPTPIPTTSTTTRAATTSSSTSPTSPTSTSPSPTSPSSTTTITSAATTSQNPSTASMPKTTTTSTTTTTSPPIPTTTATTLTTKPATPTTTSSTCSTTPVDLETPALPDKPFSCLFVGDYMYLGSLSNMTAYATYIRELQFVVAVADQLFSSNVFITNAAFYGYSEYTFASLLDSAKIALDKKDFDTAAGFFGPTGFKLNFIDEQQIAEDINNFKWDPAVDPQSSCLIFISGSSFNKDFSKLDKSQFSHIIGGSLNGADLNSYGDIDTVVPLSGCYSNDDINQLVAAVANAFL